MKGLISVHKILTRTLLPVNVWEGIFPSQFPLQAGFIHFPVIYNMIKVRSQVRWQPIHVIPLHRVSL